MRLNVTAVNPTAKMPDPATPGVPLFIGADNAVAVTFENGGATALSLAGGAPVPEKESKSVAYATVSIGFGALIDDTQAANLDVEVSADVGNVGAQPQWKWVWDSDRKFICLAVSPGDSFDLGPAESFTVTVTGLPAFQTTTQDLLTVVWNNIGAVKGQVPFPVIILRPAASSARQLTDALRLSLVSPKPLLVGNDPTTLTVRLSNRGFTPLVDRKSNGHPQFTLMLACLPEYSAQTLTTCSDAQSMSVTPQAPYTKLWQGGPADRLVSPPTWSLSALTPQVIDASAHIDFDLAPLVMGDTPGSGRLYLICRDVPGYDDGFLSLLIRKQAPASISSFTVTPEVIDTSKSARVAVALAWSADADELEIDEGVGRVTGKTSCPASAGGTTTFTLKATKRGLPPCFQSATVYDYLGFLEQHTFTLGYTMSQQGFSASSSEVLTFDRDGSGHYELDFQSSFSSGGLPVAFTWQLAGDTVTIVPSYPFTKFGVRIVDGALVYSTPFSDIKAMPFQREGAKFTAAVRPATPSPVPAA